MNTESFWLNETLRLAAEINVPNKQLARQAGVGYHWLTKVRQGVITNPGICSIERVYSTLLDLRQAAKAA